jgi:hypothetical protein
MKFLDELLVALIEIAVVSFVIGTILAFLVGVR